MYTVLLILAVCYVFFYIVKSPKREKDFFYIPVSHHRRRYGFGRLVFDVFMIIITGGLWIIWMFVRTMRRRY